MYNLGYTPLDVMHLKAQKHKTTTLYSADNVYYMRLISMCC